MAIEVSVNHKVHPKDKLIELTGVCAVPNGGSVVLNEREEAALNRRYPDGLPKKSVFKTKKVAGKAKTMDELETEGLAAAGVSVEDDSAPVVEGGDAE